MSIFAATSKDELGLKLSSTVEVGGVLRFPCVGSDGLLRGEVGRATEAAGGGFFWSTGGNLP